MLAWEKPAFNSPYELWREEGILCLAFREGARMDTPEMKELLRLVAAIDPGGDAPLLMDFPDQATVSEEARKLVRRVCARSGHPVAVHTGDLHCRLQADLFRQVHRPSFPFRVFASRAEAHRWVRERRQMTLLVVRG